MNNTDLKDYEILVSDVVTYPGLNMGERYIHCSIGGVRQSAKKLTAEDNERLSSVVEHVRQTKNWDESCSFRLSLAEKYYKAEITQAMKGQDLSYGFKR